MKRGNLSNVGATELWVDASFVFVSSGGPRWWAPWRRRTWEVRPEIKDWLWRVSKQCRLVLVWIGVNMHASSDMFSEARYFENLSSCLSVVRGSDRVVELVVDDLDRVVPGVAELRDLTGKRYGYRQVYDL